MELLHLIFIVLGCLVIFFVVALLIFLARDKGDKGGVEHERVD